MLFVSPIIYFISKGYWYTERIILHFECDANLSLVGESLPSFLNSAISCLKSLSPFSINKRNLTSHPVVFKVAYWISSNCTFLYCSPFSYRSSNFAIAKDDALSLFFQFLYKFFRLFYGFFSLLLFL